MASDTNPLLVTVQKTGGLFRSGLRNYVEVLGSGAGVVGAASGVTLIGQPRGCRRSAGCSRARPVFYRLTHLIGSLSRTRAFV